MGMINDFLEKEKQLNEELDKHRFILNAKLNQIMDFYGTIFGKSFHKPKIKDIINERVIVKYEGLDPLYTCPRIIDIEFDLFDMNPNQIYEYFIKLREEEWKNNKIMHGN